MPQAVADEEIERDHALADTARQEGDTFAGTRPNTGKKSIDEVLAGIKKPPAAEPEPAKPEPAKPVSPVFKPNNLSLDSAKNTGAPRAQQARHQNTLDKTRAELIRDRMGELKPSGNFLNGTLVDFVPPEPTTTLNRTEGGDSATGSASGVTGSTANSESDLIQAQRAGYFSYGVTVTGADTDVPVNTIVAEIMGGQLDGARVIGSWQRLGNFYEDLSLTFTSLEFEGEVYPVNMIAFNSSNHLPAFVSEVDRHILYRWGGLLGGAALEAAQAAALAAAAISNPEATDSVVQATTELSGEELRNLFLSEGGSRIAEQLKENFQRPITSRVFVGQDMRLLTLEPIFVKRKGSL